MCTCFHLASETDGLRQIIEAVLASRLVGRFGKAGKKVRTSGEIRPTDVVPLVAPDKEGGRSAFPMQWGFRMPGGSLVVNARLETAASKPSFRDSWMSRRCAIPASWYCEWEHRIGPNGRTTVGAKYAIRSSSAPMLWLCGLYRMENDLPVFTVLTREAVASLAWLHDRMPLILPGARVDEWIRPDTPPEELLPFALTDLVADAGEGR